MYAQATQAREADDRVQCLLADFRKLNGNERRQALALMSLEVQRGTKAASGNLELWTEAVHEALEAALGKSDGAGHGPQVVRRVLALPANWAPVEEFLTSSGLADLPHANERLVAFRNIARLVVARAKAVARHADIPLGPKLVGNVCHDVAGIFDNSFPGYVRAGLARMVARADVPRS